MAIRTEKNENGNLELVIDGWEQGIAPSPHKGIANIQGGNISTELGEVMASFNRTQQLTSSFTPVSGTLTASAGDGTTLFASDKTLTVGQWIHVTASTVTTPNTSVTGKMFTVGGGGGGGGSPSSGSRGYGGGGGGGQPSENDSVSITAVSYTVTVGAGGTAGTGAGSTDGGVGGVSSITHVEGSLTKQDVSSFGGGGGSLDGSNGHAGANGGGGSGSGTGGAGSTVTNGGPSGFNGGNGNTTTNHSAGGGGGASALGANGTSTQSGNGGNGTASSISGASVTYGGGGGGGGSTSVVGNGSGGTGGGGAGGNGTTGTAGTANTGGGGGGAGWTINTNIDGGAGGTGVAIISVPTGSVTATGGSMTTSGGNDIYTFNSSGTWAVSAINTTSAFATGYYFVDFVSGSKVKLSNAFDPTGAEPIVHGTTGTLSFTTVGQFGKPVATATESYSDGTNTQYRYYVLDANGLVWVNDTANSLGWLLTNRDTTYYGSQAAPNGLAILNGWVLVFAGAECFGKPTTDLAKAFTQVAGWTGNNLGTASIPHYAFVGHQGKCYTTDGPYLTEIFPDTTLQTNLGSNIQSYCVAPGTDTGHITVSAILNGSGPRDPDSTGTRIPAVFYVDQGGTFPVNATSGVVYWIDTYTSTSGLAQVFGTQSSSSTVTLSGAPATGQTSGTLTATWTGQTMLIPIEFSNGDSRLGQFTHNSTAITWDNGLSSSATTSIDTGNTALDFDTGLVGHLYFNTFYPIGSNASATGIVPTCTISNQVLVLPSFEISQSIAEIGANVVIGCKGNVVYAWNQIDITPGNGIFLPEANVQYITTVNQMAYVFAGNKGNIYITDGSLASLVLKVPDYCAGVPGSPGTYIDPTFTWGGSAYIRGRVYFSIQDQTSTKAGNCGGIWSFVPTQNLYLGQDTGIALRLEAENSYATYNGYANFIMPSLIQNTVEPLYYSTWISDVTSPTYGIDYSNNGTNASFPLVAETDFIPIGTMLGKKTYSQIEYKLGSPLDTGATVTAKYRTNLTDAWASLPAFNTEPNGLSGYTTPSFQQTQWLQLQFTLTPITSAASSNTFVRMKELRIR